ncbi:hypothetical protein ACFW08_20160 [Streptomyces sp. NPDC058960]|uniref:hypothetical protein n=1 Tax=Streptomyces sp. NPDC058960 TaxID=3346679 RepID=UPI00369EE362
MSVFPEYDPERLASLEARAAELRQVIGEPAAEFEKVLRALWAERFLGLGSLADPVEAYDFMGGGDDDAPSPPSS